MMKTKTLKALERSIKHWEELLTIANKELGKPIERITLSSKFRFGKSLFDISGKKCALCNVHYEYLCNGCPVYEKVYETICSGTPWEEVHDFLWNTSDKSKVTKKLVKLVEKEVKFLKSLRPPKKAAKKATTR